MTGGPSSSCIVNSSCSQHLSVLIVSSVSPIRYQGMHRPPSLVYYMCEVLDSEPLTSAVLRDSSSGALFCFDSNQDPIDSLWQSCTLDPSAGSLPWPMTLSCLPSASRPVVLKIDF